jgi:hypothetical protein
VRITQVILHRWTQDRATIKELKVQISYDSWNIIYETHPKSIAAGQMPFPMASAPKVTLMVTPMGTLRLSPPLSLLLTATSRFPASQRLPNRELGPLYTCPTHPNSSNVLKSAGKTKISSSTHSTTACLYSSLRMASLADRICAPVSTLACSLRSASAFFPLRCVLSSRIAFFSTVFACKRTHFHCSLLAWTVPTVTVSQAVVPPPRNSNR